MVDATTLQIIMYIVFVCVAGFIFFGLIYPRYFDKPHGGSVKSPLHRGRSQLIDMDVPGIISDVVEIRDLQNGTIDYHLFNRNGRFLRNYRNDDIIPLNPSQVIVDTEGPIFITKATKYAYTTSGDEINRLKDQLKALTEQLDNANEKNEWLNANMQTEIDKQIERLKDIQKPAALDWKGQAHY